MSAIYSPREQRWPQVEKSQWQQKTGKIHMWTNVKKRKKHAKRTEREDTHERRQDDLCHPLTSRMLKRFIFCQHTSQIFKRGCVKFYPQSFIIERLAALLNFSALLKDLASLFWDIPPSIFSDSIIYLYYVVIYFDVILHVYVAITYYAKVL